jgi:serine phosphatase RsbU (regulator of sigma subunit)/anti-sigma regulatory factor (Ser/Thr protein kinase)
VTTAPPDSSAKNQGLLVETLLGVAASLSASSDFDTLLANILHGARAVMRCAACSISLPDTATSDLLIHSTQRDWRKEGPWRLPKGQGIAGRVFETREPVNTADATQHAEHYKPIGANAGLPTKALLTIPLMDGASCRGVMQAMNPLDRAQFSAEDMRVFIAFGSLVSVTLGRRQAEEEARAHAVQEAERRVELELARQVQATFLPEPDAEHGPLRIQAFLEQVTGIGGDCYFFHAPQPHLLLAGVGDVTGKGSSAALDMARLTTQIELAASRCTPESFTGWLVELNNVLYEAMHAADNAVALTALLFDTGRRRVHAAAFAQHPPLCREHATGKWREVACPRQGFFGQRRLSACNAITIPLAAGSHWLVHSDGITEAVTAAGDQLARDGLVSLLETHDWTKTEAVEQIVDTWRKNLASGARDDATLLLMEDRTTPPPREFAALCTAESIRAARTFFEQWGRFAGIPEGTLLKLLVGCDEILTNVIKHAYGLEKPPGPLWCGTEVSPDLIRFIIRHHGAGITQEQAAAQADARSREEGGHGLALVRRVFSRVQFSTDDQRGSEVVLEKELQEARERSKSRSARQFKFNKGLQKSPTRL